MALLERCLVESLQCRTLRDIGWAYQAIAQHLKVMERQVQHVCTSRDHNTPKKRSGRPVIITPEQTQMLIHVASYVIFTLIPPPRFHIKLSEVVITFTCSIPMSVLIPCHLSLQLLPTVAYTGYTAACTVAYVLYVYNWQLAVMNRIPRGRSIQCIVTLPLICNF